MAAVKIVLLFFTVAKNGDVCISILHEPGEDKFGYEKPEERWLPIHTVETIMISVISMLADPNSDSPANVDAAVSYPPDWLTAFHLSYSDSCRELLLKASRVAPTERVEGGPKRWIQEEGGSLCTKKSRDGIWLGVGCKFQGKLTESFDLRYETLLLEVKVIPIFFLFLPQLKEMPSEGKFQQKAFAPLVLPVKGNWLASTTFLWTVVIFRKMSQFENPTSEINLFPTWNCIFNVIYFGEKNNDVKYVTTVN